MSKLQSSSNPPSLFGQSTTQPSSTSFFGQSTTQQPSTSFFGQSTTQQPSTSLFGQSTTQQQQSGSLFGSSLQLPQSQATGFFGTTTSPFGTRPPQQSQLLTSTQPTSPLFAKSTKFNDLPDDIKRTLEAIDSYIQGRVQIAKDLHQRKLGEEPTKGNELIKGIHKDSVQTTTLIRNDARFTKDIKAKVERAIQDIIVATRIIDGFKSPQATGASGASYLKDHAGFPLEYFARVTNEMRERLLWYRNTIEIERKLASSTNQIQSPQSVSTTLQAQNTTFLALASRAATLDADLQRIKTLYTQLWRAKTGSARDPFNELDQNVDAGGLMDSVGV